MTKSNVVNASRIHAHKGPSKPILTERNNYVDIDELLELLGYKWSRGTIYRWMRDHKLPARKVRGRWLFDEVEVEAWLNRS